MSSHLDPQRQYEDEKFSILNFKQDQGAFKRISAKDESLCILPFDLNANNQVRNVYLFKYDDYLSNRPELRCITKTLEVSDPASHYETINRFLNSEMNLSPLEIDHLFYLGKIHHTVPFFKKYACYGIDLTDLPLTVKQEGPLHTIEKLKFSRLINGEVQDSLALAAATLLLSYLSE